MKESLFRWSKFTLLTTCLLALALAAGCSDDDGDDITDTDTGNLSITSIIINPKSPAPGDTVQLTAVVVSDKQVGGTFDDVSIQWSGGGNGQFLESDQLSVRWVAPQVSELSRITCEATGTSNSASRSTNMFVGIELEEVGAGAGQIMLKPSGDDYFYLQSSTPITDDRIALFDYGAGTPGPVVAGGERGTNHTLSADQMMAAHQVEDPDPLNTENPIDVYITDIGAGTEQKITLDGSLPGGSRHHQYTQPAFSPDGNLVAFEAFLPNFITGAVDTFDLQVRNLTTGVTARITETHDRRTYFFPSFTPDGQYLVFVTDRASNNTWELFGLPVVAGAVSSDEADIVRGTASPLTVTTGAVANDLPEPLMVWHPTQARMALRDALGTARIIDFPDPGSGTQLSLEGTIREMVWSPSGAALAISTGTALLVWNGSNTEEIVNVGSDNLRDVTWSPSEEFLAYRVNRGASAAWLELIDYAGNSGVTGRVVVTPSQANGDVDAYRAKMSTAPVFNAAGEIRFLSFGGQETPAISRLDVSAAIGN